MLENKLLLLSGNDIPFEQAQLIIHPPKIKQIAYIGEDNFYTGCQFLTFSKDKIKKQDKNNLQSLNDFDILMTIIRSKEAVVRHKKVCMELVLSLLFPNYKLDLLPNSILLSELDNNNKTIQRHTIDKDNFQTFKKYIKTIFCLQDETAGSDSKYNPAGPQAQAIVQKFKMRDQRLAKIKGQKDEHICILMRYVSVLAVGQSKNMNELLQYTVYQLTDEYRRFKLKDNFDHYVALKLAGAKDIEEQEYWMNNIHPDK